MTVVRVRPSDRHTLRRALADGRRHPRVQVDFRVLRRDVSGLVPERGRDISLGGLSLLTEHLLLPGTDCELVVATEDGRIKAPVRARVRHVRSQREAPPFLVGLKVLGPERDPHPDYAQLMRGLFGVPERGRAHRRIQVFTEAVWLGSPRGPMQIHLTNLSLTGARVEGPNAPPLGEKGEVHLVCVRDGELRAVPAVCVWNRSTRELDRAGLRFDADAETRAFLERVIDAYLFHSGPWRPRLLRPERELFQVGDFEVQERIGEGGMSELFRARAVRGPLSGSALALKRLRPEFAREPRHAERFRLEADLGRLLRHRAFARVHGLLEFGGEHWMVMELIEGRDLGHLLAATIARGVRPPLRTVTGIVGVVLDALDHCHSLQSALGRSIPVVHGDVTLSNVMVTPGGEVKLLDLGVATTPDSELPEGKVAGKLEYLAPELLQGARPTPSADLYQAAVLLYEALVGSRPFRGNTTAELIAAIRKGPVPPSRIRGDVPTELEAVLLAALSPDPRQRPESARAFLVALFGTDCCPTEDETGALVQHFYARAVEVEQKAQLLIPGASQY